MLKLSSKESKTGLNLISLNPLFITNSKTSFGYLINSFVTVIITGGFIPLSLRMLNSSHYIFKRTYSVFINAICIMNFL